MLNPKLDAAFSNAAAQNRPLSLLLIDIDYFKTVNDAFGHSRGDQVLSEFAARLLRIVRSGDSVFRYGGDEFLILLEDADLLSSSCPGGPHLESNSLQRFCRQTTHHTDS